METCSVAVVRHESLCKSGPWKHVVLLWSDMSHCVRVAHGNIEGTV